MSEERREMDDILKEVDDFFQQCGILEAVEAFISSDEVTKRVENAAMQLISNIQKMEATAPNDEIKSLFNEACTDFESDHTSFMENILSTFKVNFSSALHLVVDLTDDKEMRELFIESVRTAIPRKGMMDINDICATLVEMYSDQFMKTIYRNYVPDDMPEELADFLCNFLGGIMLPVKAVFPELLREDGSEDYSDEVAENEAEDTSAE